jgi:hypothetical protein
MTARMCAAMSGVKMSPGFAPSRSALTSSWKMALCPSISSGFASLESFGSFSSSISRFRA